MVTAEQIVAYLQRTEPLKGSFALKPKSAAGVVAYCVRAQLDPEREGVTWYEAKGKLVVVVHHDTYVARAAATGEFGGMRSWCEVRGRESWTDGEGVVHDTEIVIAKAEVVRAPKTYVGYTVQVEVNVYQYAKGLGKADSPWAWGPEMMALKCARVEALKQAFPEVLFGLPDGVGQDVEPAGDGDVDPLQEAAQKALETRAKDRDPQADEAERSATAKVTKVQWAAFLRSPAMHGYSEKDAESVIARLWNCQTKDLNGRKLKSLGDV